ncbi:MAG: dienelactone hydrolase family protein [Acidobacteria bacterium]|nr:dienelactone hydrolase family protein [Acidobacteriota bacterium]
MYTNNKQENEDPVHELVHLYVDGAFKRRELFSRLTKTLGSSAAATAALSGYSQILAQTPAACPADVRVPLDAPDIVARDVEFNGEASKIFAHFAYPRNLDGKVPGVIIIHENQGLLEHHKDVSRRFAHAGFAAVAVDLISRFGGAHTMPNATDRSAAYGRTTNEGRRADLISTLDYLKFTPFVHHDRIGLVGFCAGGNNVWDMVVNFPEFAAAVPFYGSPPPVAQIPNIRTPLLIIAAENDARITNPTGAILGELIARQKKFGMRVYEGTGHGFANDTSNAYRAEPACEAFRDTIAFFNKFLRA